MHHPSDDHDVFFARTMRKRRAVHTGTFSFTCQGTYLSAWQRVGSMTIRWQGEKKNSGSYI
jgi:hypothetical protein